jgi:hypothetical protein
VSAIHIHRAEFEAGSLLCSADGTVVPGGNFLDQREENYAVAQINHYYCKTEDEFVIKAQRGYCDHHRVDPNTFRQCDFSDVLETSIQRRLPALRRMMGRVRRRTPARVVLDGSFRSLKRAALEPLRRIVGRDLPERC